LCAAPLGAEPDASHPVAIAWDAPAGCPDRAYVERETDRLLGGRPRGGERRLEARAVALRLGPDRWRLRLRTESGGAVGRRVLDARTCQSLADAAALVIALGYDPDAVRAAAALTVPGGSGPEPTPAPASPPGSESPASLPTPSPSPAPSPPPPPPDRSPRPSPELVASPPAADDAPAPGWLVAAGAALDAGALPDVAVGLQAGAGITWRPIRVELAGTYWIAQQTRVGGGKGADVSFASGSLGAGLAFAVGPFELGPAAGVELGRIHAEAFGVSNPGEATVLWAAATAGALAGWSFEPPLALRLGIEAVVPFKRPRWVIEGVGAVDQPGPVGGRARLGLEARF
jgi:hypothetical protein